MLTQQMLLQLIIIIVAVHVCGYLSKKIGLQWVIGEILAGLILGPTVLGTLFPEFTKLLFPLSTLPILQTLGDLGLILYMFSLGAQLDVHLIQRQSRRVLIVSLSGVLLPFTTGALLALILYPKMMGVYATPITFLLLLGTAMAITAFPVLARLLGEMQIQRSRIGTMALMCAAIDDVIAWCLLALMLVITQPGKNPLAAVIPLALTVLFVLTLLLVVRPLLVYVENRISSKQILAALSFTLLFLAAYTTSVIGIHPVFGAFLMGICLPRKQAFLKPIYSMQQINMLLFLPLYFVYSGLRTQVSLINSPLLWLICLLVFATACVGKIGGGMLSSRWTGLSNSWREALCLGILMNTRGLVELIILNIGLDRGIISPTLFAMLVLMVIATTVVVSFLLPLCKYGGIQIEKLPGTLESLAWSAESRMTTRPEEPQLVDQLSSSGEKRPA